MASKLYEVLNKVELARQNAVKNAKAANLPATDDMSLNALSSLYLAQNNNEPVIVDTVDVGVWEEPEDWIDIETILENEPNLIYNGKEYIPIFIALITDDYSIKPDLINSTSSSYNTIIKTSDGQILKNGTISGSADIVWDTSKDVPCSAGYNMRYFIMYELIDNYNNAITRNGYVDLPSFKFYNKPVLKVVFGPHPFQYLGTFYNSSDSKQYCNTVKYIKQMPGSTVKYFSGVSANGELLNVRSLKRIEINRPQGFTWDHGSWPLFNYNLDTITIRGVEHIKNSNSTSSGTFYSLYFLKNLSIEQLKTITGCFIYDCDVLEELNLPNLEKSTGTIVYAAQSLKTLSLPNLRQSSIIAQSCESLEYISLPNLTKVEGSYGSLIKDCTKLKELLVPKLESIKATGTSFSGSDGLLIRCDSLKYAQFPSLIELNSKGTLCTSRPTCVVDFPLLTKISIGYLTYEYTKSLKIVVPNLKELELQDIMSSVSYRSTIYLEHNDYIDIVLHNNATNRFSYVSDWPIVYDDKVNTITFDKGLSLPTLFGYLDNIKYKRLVCTITKGSTISGTNQLVRSNDNNVLCKEGAILDLANGSDISSCNNINRNNLVKILNNLITLENETRTLIIGTENKNRLTNDDIAIATNKGWVIK